MRFATVDFRPRALPTLVTVVLFAGLVGLGLWQLSRAEQKEALLEQWQARRDGASQPLPRVLAGKAARFTPVAAKGRFDRRHQFLLDNQIRDGRAGFHVLTPLRLPGSERAILVNRGWLPMGNGRRDLPQMPVPEGPVRITGSLAPPPQAGIRLGAPDSGQGGWPKVIQYMEPERVSDQLGYPVAGRVIRLDPGSAHGFQRDWGPPVRYGPERHIGYAVQWFALATALLIIYLVVNCKREEQPDGVVHSDQ